MVNVDVRNEEGDDRFRDAPGDRILFSDGDKPFLRSPEAFVSAAMEQVGALEQRGLERSTCDEPEGVRCVV